MDTKTIRTAVLATGGMDSTTLLYMLAREQHRTPTVLTADYGQAAFERQVELLDFHCDLLGLNLVRLEVPLSEAQTARTPGLLDPEFRGPEQEDVLGDYDKLRYREFFIEGRNLTMMVHALAWCSANKVDELHVGYLMVPDEWARRRDYKLVTGDNSPHFVDLVNVLALTGFSHQVRVRAPFYELRWDKENVVKEGRRLGVDFHHTHSCYWPEPCGKCDNCLLRAQVLGEGE